MSVFAGRGAYKNNLFTLVRVKVLMWGRRAGCNGKITAHYYLSLPFRLVGHGKRVYETGYDTQVFFCFRSNDHGAWVHTGKNGAIERSGAFLCSKYDGVWRWFRNDGRLSRQEAYRRGRKHGVWRFFDDEREICGEFTNGKPYGLWTWYDAQGDTLCSGNVTKAGRDGRWIGEGYRPGITVEGVFRKGVRDGEWVWREAHGRLLGKGRYENNTPVGRWVVWHANGRVKAESEYDTAGNATGKWHWFAKDGTALAESEFRNNTGTYYVYDDRDELIVSGRLDGGKPCGKWKWRTKQGMNTTVIEHGHELKDDRLEFVFRVKGLDIPVFVGMELPLDVTAAAWFNDPPLFPVRSEGSLPFDEGMFRAGSKTGGGRRIEVAVGDYSKILSDLQAEDGRWGCIENGGFDPNGDVRVTAFALLSYFSRGYYASDKSQHKDRVVKAIRWLISKQNSDGSFGSGRVLESALSTVVVANSGYAPVENVITKGAAFLLAAQTREGGWGLIAPDGKSIRNDIYVSEWALAALHACSLENVVSEQDRKRVAQNAKKYLEQVIRVQKNAIGEIEKIGVLRTYSPGAENVVEEGVGVLGTALWMKRYCGDNVDDAICIAVAEMIMKSGVFSDTSADTLTLDCAFSGVWAMGKEKPEFETVVQELLNLVERKKIPSIDGKPSGPSRPLYTTWDMANGFAGTTACHLWLRAQYRFRRPMEFLNP